MYVHVCFRTSKGLSQKRNTMVYSAIGYLKKSPPVLSFNASETTSFPILQSNKDDGKTSPAPALFDPAPG
jgi:hypothetical protein